MNTEPGTNSEQVDLPADDASANRNDGSVECRDASEALGVWMVIPWKNYDSAVAFWIFVVAGFGSALVLETYPWQSLPTGLEHIGAVVGGGVGLVALLKARAVRRIEKSELEILQKADAADDQITIATIATRSHCCQHWSWRRGFQPTYQAIASAFTARGWTVPRNIIDQNCAEAIWSIQLTEVLLEPETARAYATWSSFLNWIIVSGGLSYLILGSWITSGWWRVGVGVTGLLLLVYGWIFLQQTLTGRSSVNYGTIGLGVIELGDGRCLQANDCITLVYQRTYLQVQLLDAEGADVILSFASLQDPGFQHFWIRWNHPQPRPELMT